MMVRPRTMKPQNVRKCATPGTVQVSRLRWPNTSTSCARSRAPRPSVRPGAGRPLRIRRLSQDDAGAPTTASAMIVITSVNDDTQHHRFLR